MSPNLTHKKVLGPLLLLVIYIFGINKPVLAQGIHFQQKDIEQLVAEAKQQSKMVFVEIYLKGCSHCEAIAPVLKEEKVGDFFNSNFVSAKYEANDPLSKDLQEKKKLYFPEFPLLFFFDAEGNLIHQVTPSDQPTRPEFIAEVLRHANDALAPATRTSGYAARYGQGERDLNFLLNYAKYAKTTRDTTSITMLSDEFGQVLAQPADLESPYGFYVISRYINDFRNPAAQYFFKNLDTYRTKHGGPQVLQAGESILFQSLYGKNSDNLKPNGIATMRQAMESLGVAPGMAAMRTIVKELEAYFREKNTPGAVARFEAYQQGNFLRTTDYAYLTRLFNERANDTSYAAPMVRWIDEALVTLQPAEKNKAEVAELYREQSEAYHRLGKNPEGKKAAEIALDMARALKEKTDSYDKQLAKFR